ncbi:MULTISPECIES: GGDEF domain-containing protein [unclassified Thiocapsa]|uniref:GGDEF domain-containing protein n=1 Tax=unclassified Thiocapsa TaxID=2641286 RepID=UPI0035B45A74
MEAGKTASMGHASALDPDFLWALYSYVMDSGRLLVVEVDRDGCIIDSNLTFRSRFAGFAGVRGERLSRFLSSGSGELLDIEPGLPRRTPMARVFTTPLGGETYLFHAYPSGQGIVLIGELANGAESDVVERMGNLAMEMSRLVRDLRNTNRELALANETNQALARTDPLTNLANRRFFMERFDDEIVRARMSDAPLSLVMVDLDHFKQINDRFGHAGGDLVLVAFAGLLQSRVRTGDLPGRLGGEEFAVLMPDAGVQTAVDVAERLRTSLADLRPLDAAYCITASLGVAERRPEEAADELLRRADDLLYQAKNTGRNQVVASSAAAFDRP